MTPLADILHARLPRKVYWKFHAARVSLELFCFVSCVVSFRCSAVFFAHAISTIVANRIGFVCNPNAKIAMPSRGQRPTSVQHLFSLKGHCLFLPALSVLPNLHETVARKVGVYWVGWSPKQIRSTQRVCFLRVRRMFDQSKLSSMHSPIAHSTCTQPC